MKIQIESTTKIIELVTEGGTVPARVWEGVTESGIPCQVFVTRVAVLRTEDNRQFQAELEEHRAPSADVAALFPRMVL